MDTATRTMTLLDMARPIAPAHVAKAEAMNRLFDQMCATFGKDEFWQLNAEFDRIAAMSAEQFAGETK